MNRSITDTNVILNLAISPSLWLMSSNLIIIKNPIKGYNNKLRVATINMNFGVNENLNKINTQIELNAPSKSKPQNVIKQTTQIKTELVPKNTTVSRADSLAANEHNSDLVVILVLSSLSGYIVNSLAVKYVL